MTFNQFLIEIGFASLLFLQFPFSKGLQVLNFCSPCLQAVVAIRHLLLQLDLIMFLDLLYLLSCL